MHSLLFTLLLVGAAVVQSSLLHRPIDTSTTDLATVDVDTRRRPREAVDTSRTGGVDWNNVVDIIFSLAKRDVAALGKDVIPLSELRRNFTRKYGFFTVSGRFLANQGSLSNLTSFRRVGDVSAVRESPLVYKMVCTLTLDDLRVRYDHYELDVFGFGPRGHLEATVTSNTIRMTLTFSNVADDGCLSALREVKLTELGGLRMNVSGLGDFDSLGSAIATWIVEQRRAELVDGVERVLAREIKTALQDFQCDEYASLLLL